MPLAKHSTAGRDHRGNLPGGETNYSMQSHVQGETLEDIEHKRYLAHKQAVDHATFPTEISFNGVTLPLVKYGELEQLSKVNLKNKAMNLRDMIEATESNFFGHYPKMVLRTSTHPEDMMKWVIDVQVILCKALKMGLDHASFGLPVTDASLIAPPAMEQRSAAAAPCWSQEGLENRSNAQPVAHDAPCWSHGYENTKQAAAAGPPVDASRFMDAAHIARKNTGSSLTLG